MEGMLIYLDWLEWWLFQTVWVLGCDVNLKGKAHKTPEEWGERCKTS